jgi:hypothetical protein
LSILSNFELALICVVLGNTEHPTIINAESISITLIIIW